VLLALPVAQLAKNFSGTVAFYRADDPKLDREFPLEAKADGTQSVDVSKFSAGSWRVRAAWVADGKNYFIEEQIAVAAR